ncbi:neurexin-1-alpha [Clonorchis sinensis]|uniref:Neurexin-1-alpha n=1 Tax=Clonorchis sinensis TaxID=79923 RepID=G7Y7D0_CLOSI|nr:neurexin-1-alpha [Clonorchis sinensis]
MTNKQSTHFSVGFAKQCQLSSEVNMRDRSVAFRGRHSEEAYLLLSLPPGTGDRHGDMSSSGSSLSSTKHWHTLTIHFDATDQQDALLFVLQSTIDLSQQMGNRKPYAVSQTTLWKGRGFLGAEFRNGSLVVVIEKDKKYTYAVDLGKPPLAKKSGSLRTSTHILSVSFLVFRSWNSSTSTEWPIVRAKLDIHPEWIYAGPKGDKLDLIYPDQVEELLTKYTTVQDPFWFGRHLFVGGLNFTETIQYGQYPNLHSVSGLRRGFVGCIVSIQFNQVNLDLRSAVEARHRFSDERVLQAGCAVRSGSKLPPSPCQTIDYQSLRQVKDQCKQATPTWIFNGRQLIRIEFPSIQRAPMELVGLSFRTPLRNTMLLYTHAEMFDVMTSTSVGIHSLQSSLLFGQVEGKHSGMNSTGLAISVLAGALQIKYTLDNFESVVTLPGIVSDDMWHTVQVERRGQILRIWLDGTQTSRSILLHRVDLPVGGIVIGRRYQSQYAPGVGKLTESVFDYMGQIRGFHFNGITFNGIKSSMSTVGLSSTVDGSRWIVEATSGITENESTATVHGVTFATEFLDSECYAKISFQRSEIIYPISFKFRPYSFDGIVLYHTDFKNTTALILKMTGGSLRAVVLAEKHRHEVNILNGVGLIGNWIQLTLVRLDKFVEVRIVQSPNGSPSVTSWKKLELPVNFRLDTHATHLIFGSVPSEFRQADMESGEGFKGCIGDTKLWKDQPVDILQYEIKHATNKYGSGYCRTRIRPGCSIQSKIACLDTETKEVYGENSAEKRCWNDGRCLQKWKQTVCECTGTAFQGPGCEAIGTTVYFGRKQTNVTTASDKFISEIQQVNSVVVPGYIELQFFPWVHTVNWDQWVVGMQTNVRNESLQVNAEESRMTILRVFEEDQVGNALHLYLLRGRLHVSTGSPMSVLRPVSNLDDGLFHRIRGFRADTQFWLEVDGQLVNYTVQRSRQTFTSGKLTVFISHSGIPHYNDHFKGYLSGITFNGLKLLDVAFDAGYRPDIRVIRYGRTDLVSNFQPVVAAHSPFFNNKKPQLSKTIPKFPPAASIFNSSWSYHHMIPRINGGEPFLNGRRSGPYSSQWKKTANPEEVAQYSVSRLRYKIGLWLLTGVVILGVILCCTIAYLIIRCQICDLRSPVLSNKAVYHEETPRTTSTTVTGQRTLSEPSSVNRERGQTDSMTTSVTAALLVNKPGFRQEVSNSQFS